MAEISSDANPSGERRLRSYYKRKGTALKAVEDPPPSHPYAFDKRFTEELKARSFGGSKWNEEWSWFCAYRDFRGGEYTYPLSALAGKEGRGCIDPEKLKRLRELKPPPPAPVPAPTALPFIVPAAPEASTRSQLPTCCRKPVKPLDLTCYAKMRYQKRENRYNKVVVAFEKKQEDKLAAIALELYSSHQNCRFALEGSTCGHSFICLSGVFYHLNFWARDLEADGARHLFFAEFDHPSLSLGTHEADNARDFGII